MNKCAICNEQLNRLENQTEVVEYRTSNGSKKVFLEGLKYYKCNSCGETFYSPEDMELHDRLLEKVLEKDRKAKGLLTAEEIKQVRKKLGLTQSQLENLLNISPKNVAKWETYRSDQSKTVDKILRLIRANHSCFIALLMDSPVKNDKNLLQKHLANIDYYITIELITKLYPDLKEEQISFELVKQIDKILKDSINKHVEINEAHEISLRKVV